MDRVYAGARPRPGRRLLPNALRGGVRYGLGFVRMWRKRVRDRCEVGAMNERQLNDMGLSWPKIAFEIEKPFWRE